MDWITTAKKTKQKHEISKGPRFFHIFKGHRKTPAARNGLIPQSDVISKLSLNNEQNNTQ